MPKLDQSFFVYCIQSKEKFFLQKKSFLKKSMNEGLNQKWKKTFLTALATVIKKDSIMSIRKHANKLKVHEKTVKTAIKQDLNPKLNPLDYAKWDVLENKTNTTSHPNIGSVKAAIEEEWNEISEEFILKACKSFWIVLI